MKKRALTVLLALALALGLLSVTAWADVEIAACPNSVGQTLDETGEVKPQEEDDAEVEQGEDEPEEEEEEEDEDESDEDTDLTITDVKLSKTSFTWSGKVQVPEVKAVYSGDELVSSSDYKVKVHTPKSKNVGTYYITVSGQEDYDGEVKVSYTIRQKEWKDLPNVTGVKGKGDKGSFSVEWTSLGAKERKKRKIGKIQLQYRYKKDGTIQQKTYRYPTASKKSANASIVVKNLKKKGDYQVQIRHLGESNKNMQHVSKKWSKWLTIKVK